MFLVLGKGINVYISLACEKGHVTGGSSKNNDFSHSNRQNLESLFQVLIRLLKNLKIHFLNEQSKYLVF